MWLRSRIACILHKCIAHRHTTAISHARASDSGRLTGQLCLYSRAHCGRGSKLRCCASWNLPLRAWVERRPRHVWKGMASPRLICRASLAVWPVSGKNPRALGRRRSAVPGGQLVVRADRACTAGGVGPALPSRWTRFVPVGPAAQLCPSPSFTPVQCSQFVPLGPERLRSRPTAFGPAAAQREERNQDLKTCLQFGIARLRPGNPKRHGRRAI